MITGKSTQAIGMPSPLTKSNSNHLTQQQKAGQSMSQIIGIKKPLSHTNSLTKLPKYAVETPHEEDLGKLLEDIDKWGLDMFKVNDLSLKHALTSVTYTIFRVRKVFPLY